MVAAGRATTAAAATASATSRSRPQVAKEPQGHHILPPQRRPPNPYTLNPKAAGDREVHFIENTAACVGEIDARLFR